MLLLVLLLRLQWHKMKWIKQIPVIAWVIGGLIAAWLVWFYLIPYIEGLIAKAEGKANQNRTGQKPTLNKSDAQGVADDIQNACNELWSNDNTAIETAIQKIANDADFYEVQQAFGVQTWELGLKSGNLSAFLHAFLDATEIKKINQILADNGVKSQF